MSFTWIIDTVTGPAFRPLLPEIERAKDKLIPSFKYILHYTKNKDKILRGSSLSIPIPGRTAKHVTQVVWYFQFTPKMDNDWIAQASCAALQDSGLDVCQVGVLTWDDPSWRPMWLAVTPQGLAEFLA